MKWLCDLQRVKRELFPMAVISSAVNAVQLWVLPPPLPPPFVAVLAGAELDAVAEVSGVVDG